MTEPEPTIKPTRPSHVVTALVLGAMLAVLMLFGGQKLGLDNPQIPWTAWTTIAGSAMGAGILAFQAKKRVRHLRSSVSPRWAFWMPLLAKASRLSGAFLVGTYAVLVAMTTQAWPAPNAVRRAVHGGLALLFSVLWAVAGRALEKACRVPEPPDEEGKDGRSGDESRYDTP